MGELVQLFKPKCRCGWKYPHSINLQGVIPNPFVPLRCLFLCPQCGETIEYNPAETAPVPTVTTTGEDQ